MNKELDNLIQAALVYHSVLECLFVVLVLTTFYSAWKARGALYLGTTCKKFMYSEEDP